MLPGWEQPVSPSGEGGEGLRSAELCGSTVAGASPVSLWAHPAALCVLCCQGNGRPQLRKALLYSGRAELWVRHRSISMHALSLASGTRTAGAARRGCGEPGGAEPCALLQCHHVLQVHIAPAALLPQPAGPAGDSATSLSLSPVQGTQQRSPLWTPCSHPAASTEHPVATTAVISAATTVVISAATTAATTAATCSQH